MSSPTFRVGSLSAVAAVAAGTVAIAIGSHFGRLVLLLASVIVVCCLLPKRSLPSIAIVASCCIPTESLPLTHLLVGVPVGLAPMTVWVIKSVPSAIAQRSSSDQGTRLLRGSVVALLLWIPLSALFAPFLTEFAGVWSATAIVGLLTIWVVAAGEPIGVAALVTTLRWISLALSSFAVLEKWVLHENPIFGHLYQLASTPLVQKWESYRATTLMGHPLVNVTFFAVGLVLWTAWYVERSTWSPLRLAPVLVCGCGVVATVSRTGLIASAVGAVAYLLLSGRLASSGARRRRRVLVFVGAVGAVLATVAIAPRLSSGEGAQSAEVRADVPAQTAASLSGHYLFGVGPGMSERFRVQSLGVLLQPQDQQGGNLSQIEDAYAQTAVGLGLPGLAVFFLIPAQIIYRSMRQRRRVAVGAAVITMAVAVGSYNAFEGHLQVLLVFLVLMAAALDGERRSRRRSDLVAAEQEFSVAVAASRSGG